MGSACCVAVKDRTLPNRTSSEAPHRSGGYSPSWSFHWDNRRRVAGEVENLHNRYSRGRSGNVGLEIKGRMDVDTEDISDGESPMESFRTPAWQKSPVHEGAAGNLTTPASGKPFDIQTITFCSNMFLVKDLTEASAVADPSASKLSFSVPSTSFFPVPKSDILSTPSHPLPTNSTPSRRARRSPGHQLLREVPDSRIWGLKSPNNNSISEGRQSFVLSTCSNDLTLGSQGGSSDGWSMRTFSELVASSQRERWSFDSESLGSSRGKITRSDSQPLSSPSVDLQTCWVCSKLLTERSSWGANELSVVAVLVCGHVYHAECLENMTSQNDRYDPPCPICVGGGKQALKISGKASRGEADLKLRFNRISRNRVMDSDVDGDSAVSNQRRREGKAPKIGGPDSSRRSSFAGPFLRRHFSLGLKSTRSLSVSESSSRRKGFWARYRKE
ncbi:zinc finger protein [Macleaya cordata]|uniref:Zinc finger protein n=1 Tax=Macleaya cordata TaxID=56857 RepID=A0A200Q6W6_MACCD|nr:zinc finger protein [Macleaya cordata]